MAKPGRHTRIDRNMNLFRCILISTCLLPALGTALAQQSASKPVLSADPTVPAAPPPAPPPISPEAGPLSLSPNYIIGADDGLKIEVWKEEQLSATLTVRPDGKISLPLINDIPAAGLTPMQLAADITSRLTKFVTDPVVNVSVVAVNSKRIFMIGEIGHVGPIQMTPGMTVLQAIATAGGLTPYANKKHIYIWRGDPGKQQKIPFDYDKALKKGDMQGISLLPGDTIVVP
jgi:polysaccharide export outer membrane protein